MNKVEENKIPDYTFSKKIEDKFVYLIAFLVGIIVLTIGSMLFLGPFVYITKAWNGDGNLFENIMNNMIVYQGFLSIIPEIIGIVVALVFLRPMFKGDIVLFRTNWKRYLICIVSGIIGLFLFSLLFDVLVNVFNIEGDANNQEVIEVALKGDGKWAMIISVAIVAPIFEELVFRKFLYGFLSRIKLHIVLTTIIIALLFALVHCTSENFLTLIAYFFLLNYLSLSLCLTVPFVVSKGNMYVSIIIHMFNNIYNLLLIFGVINDIF